MLGVVTYFVLLCLIIGVLCVPRCRCGVTFTSSPVSSYCPELMNHAEDVSDL